MAPAVQEGTLFGVVVDWFRLVGQPHVHLPIFSAYGQFATILNEHGAMRLRSCIPQKNN